MAKSKTKITIFEGKDGWRWHAKRCGHIVATSGGDGYKRKNKAHASLAHLILSIQNGDYTIAVQEPIKQSVPDNC